MKAPALGSILLGTDDAARLREWYSEAFGVRVDEYGWLNFGEIGVLIDGRDDVATRTAEPGRVVLNFHTEDARGLAAHLDGMGATWLVPVEERENGLFATLTDPDGNYIQIIELSEAYLARRAGVSAG
jgi:predicted enzyme related to lactoylglutathione lyase